jgi:plastocyanin
LRAVGRLLGIALAVAAAGIVVIVVNGAGIDRPEEAAPARASAHATPSATQGQQGAATRPATVGATVRMRALRFVGGNVSVPHGQAVRFVNADDVAHTVMEDVGARSGLIAAFESRRIPPGGSFTYVTKAAGTIPFVCTLHPTVMSGTIDVS